MKINYVTILMIRDEFFTQTTTGGLRRKKGPPRVSEQREETITRIKDTSPLPPPPTVSKSDKVYTYKFDEIPRKSVNLNKEERI